MSSPYTITPTPPTSLKLEAGQEGTFSFTVTSLSAPDSTQDVMLQALLFGPDEKGKEVDWLVPDPKNGLTIAGGKTATVTITARPIPTTPKGEHSIKLSIADKNHPNDKFAYSAPVTCEVTAKPQVIDKKPLPKWLIPVIAGAVVVLGVGIFLIVKFAGGGGGGDDSGLGAACDGAATPCKNGLICSPDQHKCLLPAGARCKENSLCVSGECVTKLETCSVPIGAACKPADKDTIPCLTQTTCHPDKKLCLGNVGAACTGDTQCETEKCTNNVCVIKAPAVKAGDPCESTCPAPLQCSPAKRCVEQAGRPCTANVECITGLCEGGTCTEAKPPRNCTADGICGQDQKCVEIQPNLKRCGWNPGHPCASNAECTSQWCNGGSCTRDDGKCDSQSDCPAPYVCILSKQQCKIPNGARCGGHGDCDSTFCNSNNICAPSPCQPPCTGRFVCNNNPAAPRCDPILIIIRPPDVILKPFKLPN